MNKYYLTLGVLILIIFGSLSGTILYIHKQQSESNALNQKSSLDTDETEITETGVNAIESTPTPTKTSTTNTKTNTQTTKTLLTTSSVGTHSSKSNCWIIISSKVYNVTNFLDIHPGGVISITPYCGKDATIAFNSNTVGHSHSSYARSLLPSYYVGDIGSQLTATPTPTPLSNQNPITLDGQTISTHNSQQSCWIIISGSVYDVTSFLSIHPGGVSAILGYCGSDASDAFNTRAAGHSHSSYARSLLPTYFIGTVGGTASATSTPSGTTQTPPRLRDWDDD